VTSPRDALASTSSRASAAAARCQTRAKAPNATRSRRAQHKLGDEVMAELVSRVATST